MGVALLAMVVTLSRKRAATEDVQKVLQEMTPRLDRLWRRLLRLADDDAHAYHAVLAIRKEPERAVGRAQRLATAVASATRVPLETAGLANEALSLAAGLAPHAWSMVASDLTTAQSLLQGAFTGGLANVAINLSDLEGVERETIQAAYQSLRSSPAR